MGLSSGTIEIDKIEVESVQKFYEWLQGGDAPESITFATKPKISAEEAFSIIYYLQEELGILPDCYEQCKICKCLCDRNVEGVSIDEDTTIIDEDGNELEGNFPESMYGRYCDSCRPSGC